MPRKIAQDILNHQDITPLKALTLNEAALDTLCGCANEIREEFMGNAFDLCTIINAKSGACSEDCAYCAQSSRHPVDSVETYPLLDVTRITREAKYNAQSGVHRFSMVTSGKRLSKQDLNGICHTAAHIRDHVDIKLCTSNGLLSRNDFERLKQNGVTRYHNNLESSAAYFPKICTTHTYEEKIAAIRAAQNAGLSVCSGGIMGMGETMEDRIALAFTLKKLGITSVPVNILSPIPGTPLADMPVLSNDEVCRIIAIFRYILPNAYIRLAGGRGQLPDQGRKAFMSGANAVITGDMLTTSGISIAKDIDMITTLGFNVSPIVPEMHCQTSLKNGNT
ncbi:MAG: biotin synthase BioB [Acidobacteria bacterium]|nr:MAG: biotin synthase BioB [Acidobacteriota bacterium]